MTTFIHRADPGQALVFRIVAGAVKNAQDAHPKLQISPQHRNSIAKRAAGTLTASWPQVLAMRSGAPSESPKATRIIAEGRERLATKRRGRGDRTSGLVSPLARLRRQIERGMWGLRREQPERHAALVDVLKMIAALERPHEMWERAQ